MRLISQRKKPGLALKEAPHSKTSRRSNIAACEKTVRKCERTGWQKFEGKDGKQQPESTAGRNGQRKKAKKVGKQKEKCGTSNRKTTVKRMP